MTYADLTGAFRNHLQPKQNETTASFYFHARKQQPGETIAKYVTALRNLISDCNFEQYMQNIGDKSVPYVDRALRDQLVMGVLDNDTRCLLLRSAVKTLDEALTIAQGLESSSHEAGAMTNGVVAETQQAQQDAAVASKVMDVQQKQAPKPCYRCNGTHPPFQV